MPLVVIVGPTAVGKSALALELVPLFGAEIVSADSRQVYRYMDIGTAKPSPEERARVPHHLIDVVNPDEDFNVSHFQRLAYQAIDDIHRRGRLPFLVGGTGLWIWAVVEGLRIPQVPPQPELRRQLEELAAREGVTSLYHELLEVDPDAARRIDPHNVRRVIRALEVYRVTGKPISWHQRREPPSYATLILGLTISRPELYRRIDERVEDQLRRGLVEETKQLVEMGYGWHLPSMSSLGYRQIGMYLRGEVTLSQAVQILKHDTHRFARQQYTWFRLDDRRIRWIEATDGAREQAAELIARFLRESGL